MASAHKLTVVNNKKRAGEPAPRLMPVYTAKNTAFHLPQTTEFAHLFSRLQHRLVSIS
jgi:hypothetical protein